jgi:UDP-N-acetylglucosamine acyltransferase
MNQSNIHPTAIIEAGAKIGNHVTIEPYAVIKCHVTLEDHATVKSHAYIDGHTTIGEGSTIYPCASIGTKTQDLKFRGEKTFVKIGKNCEIREFVTINSSCQENSVVEVGDDCLIMAYCHIAHNCTVGNHVIMSNNAILAGHVHVEDYARISGMSAVHQFVRIGCHAFIGGMSGVGHDIPPYTIGGGMPFKFGGLNLIGLKRHGFPLKTRQELSKAFKLLYRSKLYLEEALERAEKELEPLPEIKHWIKFCRESKRGLQGIHGFGNAEEDQAMSLEKEEEEDECIVPRP